MKRSEINRALQEMEATLKRCQINLPPFCHFTPGEWREKGHEYDEIRDNMLGWDITDYGQGDFDKVGFSLITLRNGNLKMRDRYAKTYAEKLIYLKEGQYSPNHFHWSKMEDIINRCGGTLLIRVYNSLPDESIDRVSDVTVHLDGRTVTVPAGTQVRLGTTTLRWSRAPAPSSSARSASATTTTPTTASIPLWAASPPSRRTSPPTACCATSIRPQSERRGAGIVKRSGASAAAGQTHGLRQLFCPPQARGKLFGVPERLYNTNPFCVVEVVL